jgi:hypothetical protein
MAFNHGNRIAKLENRSPSDADAFFKANPDLLRSPDIVHAITHGGVEERQSILREIDLELLSRGYVGP